jgi:hypothetical protein
MVILANIYQCGVFIYSRAGFWSDSRQALPYPIMEGVPFTLPKSQAGTQARGPDRGGSLI